MLGVLIIMEIFMILCVLLYCIFPVDRETETITAGLQTNFIHWLHLCA